MEDWWLVRDTKVEPDGCWADAWTSMFPMPWGVYAEGQRMVGAYVLTKVTDRRIDGGGSPGSRVCHGLEPAEGRTSLSISTRCACLPGA